MFDQKKTKEQFQKEMINSGWIGTHMNYSCLDLIRKHSALLYKMKKKDKK